MQIFKKEYFIDMIILIVPLAVCACIFLFFRQDYYGRLADGRDWADIDSMSLPRAKKEYVKAAALKIIRETALLCSLQKDAYIEPSADCVFFLDNLYKNVTISPLPVFYALKLYDLDNAGNSSDDLKRYTFTVFDNLRSKSLIRDYK